LSRASCRRTLLISMQSTTVNDLLSRGFTEDPLALKAIERPFAVPLVLGVGVFVSGFALWMLKRIGDGLGVSLIAGSLCFLLLVMLCMYRSRPRSRHTGKPLLKYKNSSPDSGVIHELIYVCPDSKTFSRRVYVLKGSAVGGSGG
jgi:hypothetical protein